MDIKKISETGNDTTRIPNYNNFDLKLNLLGKHIEKVDQDIISTRNCFDYILSEIYDANERLTKEMAWNQRRLDLLKDIGNKMSLYTDKRLSLFNEYLSMIDISNNVKNLNLNKDLPKSSD